ncbi:hypothetical protein NMY22_g8055 [Coprinellus aureogranulatus]|nr:hypothetical protein NMY22_g8055 [Coprinellus aureogranulatus]
MKVVKELYPEGPSHRFVVCPPFLEFMDEKRPYGNMSPGAVFEAVVLGLHGHYITTQAILALGKASEHHHIDLADDNYLEVDRVLTVTMKHGTNKQFRYGFEVVDINLKQLKWLDGPLTVEWATLLERGLHKGLLCLWAKARVYLVSFKTMKYQAHTQCKIVAGPNAGESGYIRRGQPSLSKGKVAISFNRSGLTYEALVPFGHIRTTLAVGDEIRARKRNGAVVRSWVQTIGEVLMALHDANEDEEVGVLRESVELSNL